MKKAFSLIVVFFAITTIAFAQKGVIKFTKESHDFARFHKVRPLPTRLSLPTPALTPWIDSRNAQPSCGCTTPDWTKSAVLPGQKGFVKATYNAASMGSFNKNVTVVSNAERASIPLNLTGEVTAKEGASTAAATPAAAPAAEKSKKKSSKTSR
jgi:hypothetical protein